MGFEIESSRAPKDLRALAVFLDSKFEGPFGVRFGWDALIGLIPGVGAVIPTLVSLYIVVRGAVLGVSFFTVVRMLLNVLFDTGLSLIPIAGQFADFFWKSNLRNIELIDRSLHDPIRTRRGSIGFVLIVSLSVFGFFSALIWLVVRLVLWILG